MARDCEVFDRYNHYLQDPRSKFAGSRDRLHDDFFRREYVLDGPNIECFKCHNYGHSARGCRYQMESPMDNIGFFKCHNYGYMAWDCRNKKVWKWKLVQENKVDNKVSIVMLSGFVKEKGHEELAVTSDNDSSQDGLLGDSLFWTIYLVDSLMFVQEEWSSLILCWEPVYVPSASHFQSWACLFLWKMFLIPFDFVQRQICIFDQIPSFKFLFPASVVWSY